MIVTAMLAPAAVDASRKGDARLNCQAEASVVWANDR
jgi:hypothetical protein